MDVFTLFLNVIYVYHRGFWLGIFSGVVRIPTVLVSFFQIFNLAILWQFWCMVQLDNHVLFIVHVNFILLEVANHNFFTVPCTFSSHFLPMVLHFCIARTIYDVFTTFSLH